jgi:hypothetical protein
MKTETAAGPGSARTSIPKCELGSSAPTHSEAAKLLSSLLSEECERLQAGLSAIKSETRSAGSGDDSVSGFLRSSFQVKPWMEPLLAL